MPDLTRSAFRRSDGGPSILFGCSRFEMRQWRRKVRFIVERRGVGLSLDALRSTRFFGLLVPFTGRRLEDC